MFIISLIGSSLYADFKIMGGLNLSKYSGDESTIWSYKMGFQGGIGIEIDLTYRTLFEVDVLFFQKGSRTGSSTEEERHVLNTMSIPVLLRSKLFHGNSPYLVGGIEFAGILSNMLVQKQKDPVDLEGNLKGLDFGVVFGGGFEMEVKEKLFLFIEMRYHHGLKNLLVIPNEGLSRKTTAFMLLIGIRS